MTKKNLLLPAVILVLLAVGVLVYTMQQNKTRSTTQDGGIGFVRSSMKITNPYISPAQKFLFQNRVGTTSSPETVMNYIKAAASTAIRTSEIVLEPGCIPETPVTATDYATRITFINRASESQTLQFSAKVTLAPGQSSEIRMADIYPELRPQSSIQVRSYTCSDRKDPAGFLVIYPDTAK
ncbi:MAG TPA: hypothetical protein VF438_00985 [Candidatus Paceibacterota bacterium]